MATRRRYVDPETLDFVLEDGNHQADETHVPNVIRLLSLRKGSSPVAPELGNEMWEKLTKLGDGAERRAEQYCVRALRPLTLPRLISDLVVDAEIVGVSGLDVVVSFTDKDGTPEKIRLPVIRGV